MIKEKLYPYAEEQTTYEQFGFTKRMVKENAPRFQVNPMTHRDARLGEDIVTVPANVGPGTVLRGSLAKGAKATPFVLHVSHATPYQVASPPSKSAATILASISGPATGDPNFLDGWQLYGEFPIQDRAAEHNSLGPPTGIAIDANFVWVAEGTKLYRMPHDFSTITEITPSGSTIPAINGLASDGVRLYTVNGTAFYKITVSGTNYSFTTEATLAFSVDKIGCFTGKYFIGHHSGDALLREWQPDGTLWRDIPYQEPDFVGALMLNGFPYIATQIGSLAEVHLMPARI